MGNAQRDGVGSRITQDALDVGQCQAIGTCAKQGEYIGAGAQVDGPCLRGTQRDGVIAGSCCGDTFGASDGGNVGACCQGQYVCTGLEVNDPRRSDGRGECDDVGKGAAGDGFRARHRDGVGAVGQGDGIGASAQIKAARRYDARQNQGIIASPKADVGSTNGAPQSNRICASATYDGFYAVQCDVVGAVCQGDFVCSAACVDSGAGGGYAQRQGVSQSAAGDCFDVRDGGCVDKIPQREGVHPRARVRP